MPGSHEEELKEMFYQVTAKKGDKTFVFGLEGTSLLNSKLKAQAFLMRQTNWFISDWMLTVQEIPEPEGRITGR